MTFVVVVPNGLVTCGVRQHSFEFFVGSVFAVRCGCGVPDEAGAGAGDGGSGFLVTGWGRGKVAILEVGELGVVADVAGLTFGEQVYEELAGVLVVAVDLGDFLG